ncbi:MAG: hypothetical protein U9P79_07445 [Candidatus Cloacimonadota bacterium]|nr:hypothetical protein [Candidatus Cloacimonadota bacterium]
MAGTFMGTYEASVSNRRISIPQPYRKQFSPQAKNMVTIIRGRLNTLQIYPFDRWKMTKTRLENGPDKDKNFLRMLLRWATELKIEGPGRILIPQNLLDMAQIEKNAVFLGEGKYFTLWNPEKFAEYTLTLEQDYENVFLGNINSL